MKRIITVLLAALPVAAAIAQTPAAHGLYDNVINKPGIGWGVYGTNQTAKQVAAPAEVPGGAAVRFTISKAGAHPYDVAAFYPNTKAIAQGDTVVAMIYARAPDAKPDAPLPITFGIAEGDAPYTQIGNVEMPLTSSWKRYFVSGVSPKAFAPGKARINVQLGGAKQVVELGAAFLLDPGPGFDVSKLPRD